MKDTSLYQQVQEYILNKIKTDNLKAGDALPTESELEEALGVSRTTVRTALSVLRQNGIITQHRGKGTFVAQLTLEEHLSSLMSFTEYAASQGHVATSVVLSSDLVLPDEMVRRKLQIDKELVWKLSRLRLMDGEPIQISTSYLPKYALNLMHGWEEVDFAENSLYQFMESHGIRMEYADEILQITLADNAQAMLLSIDVGRPLFTIHRVVFDANNTPIEYVEAHTRGEQHRAYTRMRRAHGITPTV